jgi:CheY-like chemotaxis protein
MLVHWHDAEARERLERLRRAGFEARYFSSAGDSARRRELRSDLPDAFVIDLGRLPSHGREVATALRQRKSTRRVPLVFVGGEPEKVRLIRERLPDAIYTDWQRLPDELREAIRRPPESPVVPATTTVYAGTPLHRKLGIAPDSTLLLLGAPVGLSAVVCAGVNGVRIRTRSGAASDVVMLFARSIAELSRRIPTAVRALAPRGALWLAWPKQSSGLITDLTQNHVRRAGNDAGLVDYKICAIDSTWSGLCFARRVTRGRAGR